MTPIFVERELRRHTVILFDATIYGAMRDCEAERAELLHALAAYSPSSISSLTSTVAMPSQQNWEELVETAIQDVVLTCNAANKPSDDGVMNSSCNSELSLAFLECGVRMFAAVAQRIQSQQVNSIDHVLDKGCASLPRYSWSIEGVSGLMFDV